MLNYKKEGKMRDGEAFSFSRKQNYKEFDILPSERRSINGWLSTVLDPHDQDFIRAFNNSKRRNIIEVFRYIERNYPHLTQIAIYYIIGALVDYGWTIEQRSEEVDSKAKRDLFLDVMIEDLAGRFYRESQWLAKIMHIPVYYLFSLFDSHKKGYLTLQDLLKFSSTQKPAKAASKDFLLKKLKGNLGRGDGKMYLENLIQIQQRADLISFTDKSSPKALESQIYQHISNQLQQRNHQLLRQQIQKTAIEQKQSKKIIDELQLKQEDINIKDITKMLLCNAVRTKDQSQNHKHSNPPQSQAKSQSQNTLNLFITPRQAINTIPAKHNDQLQPKQFSGIDKLSNNHKKQIIDDSERQQKLISSKRKNLLVRQSILSQLQAIKYMKIRNNLQKMVYL